MLDRRDFLSQTGLGVLAAGMAAPWTAFAPNSTAEGHNVTDDDQQAIIDTHQHLWDLSKFKLPWVNDPGLELMKRNYLMADYLKATTGFNIAKTVYMEVDVDPSQQQKEADYILKLCEQEGNPLDGAVVSGRPAEKGFGPYINALAKKPLVKGVRQVLQNPTTERGYCLKPQFVEHIQLLGKLGLSFDLCMRPAEVIDTVELVDRCPKTQFILDHCGNMEVANADKDVRKSWEQAIRDLADRPHVACKISGIVVTANKDWKPADLADVVNFCLDAFGEDRVVFGGDWPVCTLRATLPQWINALREIVKDRPQDFRRKLWHDNAVKVYRLT